MLDLVALVPPVLGLTAGLAAVARGAAKGVGAWLFVVAGMLVCGLLVFSFGWELFHPAP